MPSVKSRPLISIEPASDSPGHAEPSVILSSSAWRAPMGTVVIGGLILSTVLTLVIVPAGFSLADGFEKRIGPMLRRVFLSYDPARDKEAPPPPEPVIAPQPAAPGATPATRRGDGPLPAE